MNRANGVVPVALFAQFVDERGNALQGVRVQVEVGRPVPWYALTTAPKFTTTTYDLVSDTNGSIGVKSKGSTLSIGRVTFAGWTVLQQQGTWTFPAPSVRYDNVLSTRPDDPTKPVRFVMKKTSQAKSDANDRR